MIVYLSGPMTGLPDFNFPAFRAAAASLREAGHDVLDPSEHEPDLAKTWADYMRLDLADVLRAEAVAVLPGWENSRGARLEVHVAEALGLPVAPVDDLLPAAAHPDTREDR